MSFAITAENIHPSTEACLEALGWLQERVLCRNILDMGCGHGILSVAAASIWEEAALLAVDIAPLAVEDTKENIERYALQARMSAIRSDGFLHPNITARAPFDLIIANLLPDTLLSMAQHITRHLSTDGHLLLSGILQWRAADIETAFLGLEFEIINKISKNTWQCYVMRRLS